MENKTLEPWKPIAVAVYLVICSFDFWIMPIYKTYLNQVFLQDTVKQLDPENRSYILELIDRIAIDDWEPVTVSGTGGIIFHLSFGTLLAGTALTSRTWTLSANGDVASSPNDKKKD